MVHNCLCFNWISHWFLMLTSDWLLWLAGFWSNDTLHAALERFWIHSNARSIVSFAVSFSFTRDFTVTWIFSRLIKNKFKLHSLKMFSSNLQSQLPNLSPSFIQSDKWQRVNDNVHPRPFSSRLVDKMERTLGMELKGWFLKNFLLIIVRCSDFFWLLA